MLGRADATAAVGDASGSSGSENERAIGADRSSARSFPPVDPIPRDTARRVPPAADALDSRNFGYVLVIVFDAF